MKTKIYIFRHSETDYNIEGRHDHEGKAVITEQGEQRAETIAELLGNEKVSAIYSSPLPRCINTITPLAHAQNQELIIDERLRENFLGPMQDKFWNDFPKAFVEEVHNINGEKHEGYEHMRDVRARISEFIDSVIKTHKGETIAICSHGGPIIHMLAHIDKIPSDSAPRQLMNNTGITHEDAYAVREI